MKLSAMIMTLVVSLATMSGTMVKAGTSNSSKGAPTASPSLLLYSGIKLAPERAIPFPVIPKSTNWSEVPTVAVQFTTPVTLPKPVTPPKEVLAPVPANIASRVAAYLFPINQWDWVYFIAPRGLNGFASLGNDGSDSIVLKNQHAFVELDTPGGSPLTAAGTASQFFPLAGQYEAKAVSGDKYNRSELLHPATIRYEYQHRLAVFSYHSTNGKSVYGYNFYTPSMKEAYLGAYGQSAQFVYASDGTDKGLAKWVLQSGLSSFTGIGEPELGGVPIPEENERIQIGESFCQMPVPQGFSVRGEAVNTRHGIAWVDSPQYISTGSGLRSDIPTGPFVIRLSPWSVKTLGGRDQVIIVHLSKFYDAGGYFFAVGMYLSYVLYDESTDLTANGQIKHDIWLVNLDNSERKQIPTSALKDGNVMVQIEGKTVTIPLRQE